MIDGSRNLFLYYLYSFLILRLSLRYLQFSKRFFKDNFFLTSELPIDQKRARWILEGKYFWENQITLESIHVSSFPLFLLKKLSLCNSKYQLKINVFFQIPCSKTHNLHFILLSLPVKILWSKDIFPKLLWISLHHHHHHSKRAELIK